MRGRVRNDERLQPNVGIAQSPLDFLDLLVEADLRVGGTEIADTREALAGAVAYMIETAQRPPSPAREGRRTEQVNVRLTAEEKLVLETTARRKGFQGLSDFIRNAALESANH